MESGVFRDWRILQFIRYVRFNGYKIKGNSGGKNEQNGKRNV